MLQGEILSQEQDERKHDREQIKYVMIEERFSYLMEQKYGT
jgi:hypothetical protein